MADAVTIETEGIQEVLRAFRKLDKGLGKALRAELVMIAGLVAVEARHLAESKGLVDTGTLLKSIRPGWRGSYAYVQDSARRSDGIDKTLGLSGFNYPAVYEYGKGGERAFLHPAAEAKRDEALAGIEEMLNRLARDAGFAEGSTL